MARVSGNPATMNDVRKPRDKLAAMDDASMMDMDRTACYRAIATRDARFDGRLFVGVKTTGIYCRPICPARTPKFANVSFYPTAAAAQEAGFRPCLRCRPETSPDLAFWRGTTNTVSRALALIEAAGLTAAWPRPDQARNRGIVDPSRLPAALRLGCDAVVSQRPCYSRCRSRLGEYLLAQHCDRRPLWRDQRRAGGQEPGQCLPAISRYGGAAPDHRAGTAGIRSCRRSRYDRRPSCARPAAGAAH